MNRLPKEVEEMRQRTEMLIVALGFSLVLLAALVAALSPRAQSAFAQSDPRISISMGERTLPQGGATYLVGQFYNMPQDPNDETEFHSDLIFRLDMQRSSEGTWIEENECDPSLFGRNYTFNTWWRSDITVWAGGSNNFVVESDCPVGTYRILTTAKYRSTNTVLITTTNSVTIIHGPQVEIELSSEPYYRGNEIDVTMEFTYLNNLQDGSNLTYRADVMRIISENSRNYANDCEGTALGNISKSGETNDSNFNPSDNPSGTIDDQDGDGTVEISGQIPAICPTGRYSLTVKLRDSSKRELTSATKEFVVSTDPNASPSSKVEFSPQPPVAEGTEIDATIYFYDLQDGTNIRFRTDVTKRVNNADVIETSCHDSGIGLGYDVSATVSRNPYINRVTVSSSCPAGAYTLTSVISSTTGTELVTASAGFIVGDPDLKPTAPTITGYTAKQNSPFSQELPVGTGGDGTLSYNATGHPDGLSFNRSSRTMAGTPPNMDHSPSDTRSPTAMVIRTTLTSPLRSTRISRRPRPTCPTTRERWTNPSARSCRWAAAGTARFLIL